MEFSLLPQSSMMRCVKLENLFSFTLQVDVCRRLYIFSSPQSGINFLNFQNKIHSVRFGVPYKTFFSFFFYLHVKLVITIKKLHNLDNNINKVFQELQAVENNVKA